jgi:uncharacterized protein (DUF58 family)
MIVVVIADDTDLDERDERLLRRLAAQHEVLHCTIGDVAMTDPTLEDTPVRVVGTTTTIPAFFRAGTDLHEDLVSLAHDRERDVQARLARVGVASARLGGEDAVVPSIVGLLERQRLFGTGSTR